MSIKHPIIAITGSSGAGTTSVKKTFDQIFRREKINPVYIEGDAFHRWNRLEMREQMKQAAARGDHHYSHFGPEANLFEELETTFRDYSEAGGGRTRTYVHDADEAEQHGCPPGTFTPWRDFEPRFGPSLLRGPARRRCHRQGQCRAIRRSQDRRRAGHQSRVDPETASRPSFARLYDRGGHRHDSPAHAGLHQLSSARSSRRRTSISSACRRSTRRIRSSRAGSRRPTNRWWSSGSAIRTASTSPISCR